jgi:hypothetical protein
MKSTLRWLVVASLFVGSAFASDVHQLVAPDGQAFDNFGFAVAVSGNLLAAITGPASSRGGVLYVFQKTTNWSHFTLAAEFQIPGVMLTSVAISNGVVAVGAITCTVNKIANAGCAYVFANTNGWQQVAQLTASDASMDAWFGSSIALNSGTIAVGAGGAEEAYVFTEPQGGWTNATQTAILMPTKADNANGFGGSIATGASYLVAVGSSDDPPATEGAVYIFQESENGWQNMNETAKLTDAGAVPHEHLGSSLAMLPGTIVAGAPTSDSQAAKALVYLEAPNGWQSTSTANATLTGPITGNGTGFSAVAINNNLILAQRQTGRGQGRRGGAFIFKKPAGGWVTMQASADLTAPISTGWSLAAEGGSVAIMGAPEVTINGHTEQGAVFVGKVPQ